MRTKTFNPKVEAQIGAAVRAARVAAGMSQSELAAKVAKSVRGGLTFQQIQKYENGTNRVAVSRLIEIAAATGKPISFFIPSKAA